LGHHKVQKPGENETPKLRVKRQRTNSPLTVVHRLTDENLDVVRVLSLYEEDALYNEETKTRKTRKILPEITVHLETLEVAALIDSGSEVSCVSEETWSRMLAMGRRPPTLPLTSIQLLGAVGQRSHRVRVQCFLDLQISGHKFEVVALVVSNLIKPVILGADWLHERGANVDFKLQQLHLNSSVGPVVVPFTEGSYIRGDAAGNITVNCLSGRQGKVGTKDTMETLEALKESTETCALNQQDKGRLFEILCRHRTTFSKVPGLTNKYVHEIKLHDHTPFIKRPYPVPFALRPAVEQTIEEMLNLRVIRRGASPYASPVAVVQKKDGTVRVCLDARMINSKMVADSEAPPATEELLHRFGGVRYMTTIDLRASYWQIPLSPESQQYTAFLYNGRSFMYQVLPFGLKTAVGSFSRAMDIILGPEVREFTLNYIDDLLIASRNLDDHLEHIDRVLVKLKEARMTVNLEKSLFVRSQVKFLGHILTTEGIQPDPEKIAAIRQFPEPQRIKHLRAFLGLCNYYRKFCPEYSRATRGLAHLLKKNSPWTWGPGEQKVFSKIKDIFLDTVILRHPRQGEVFYVQTDSSGYALGAELYQLLPDGERGAISFISRSLRGAELNYTTTEKELLGVVFALTKFRTFIQGQKLIIRTDHQALKFLKRCRLMNERLTRWTLVLDQYDYEMEVVKGRDNVVADILSRYPMDGGNEGGYPRQQPIIALFEVSDTAGLPKTHLELRQRQQLDPLLGSILRSLEDQVETGDPRTQRVSKYYEVHANILVYRAPHTGQVRVALPQTCVDDLVWYYHHLFGHFGAAKIYGSMRRFYHFPKMHATIRKILKTCDLCQKTKFPNKNLQGPIHPILVDNPGDLICVDFYGPLPAGRGGATYIFVAIDTFSKFLKLYALRRATARAAAKQILQDYVQYMQVKCVLSDRGTQFTSRIWQSMLAGANIQAKHTSIRHPASNPSERVMRERGRMFRAYCNPRHASWVTHLKNIEECMNTIPHSSTGYAPHEILYGTAPPAPLDATLKKLLPNLPQEPLTDIRRKVREQLKNQAKQRQRQQKGETVELQKEEWVLLREKNLSSAEHKVYGKFLPLFSGPYEISARPHSNTYRLVHPATREEKGVYNVANLKRYHRPQAIPDAGD
jgi:hypothetical protein